MRADRRVLLLAAGLLVAVASVAAKDAATVDVRGFGWLGNREMERTLELLLDDGTRAPTVDARVPDAWAPPIEPVSRRMPIQTLKRRRLPATPRAA